MACSLIDALTLLLVFFCLCSSKRAHSFHIRVRSSFFEKSLFCLELNETDESGESPYLREFSNMDLKFVYYIGT